MVNLSFIDFQEICKLNSELKYVSELLESIKSLDVLFHPGIVMERNYIASLYKTRLENAKEYGSLNAECIKDYEETVAALFDINSKDLGLTTIYSDQYLFLVFYEPVTKKILGVLRSKHPLNLQEMEGENTDIVDKRFSSGFQKYSKGELVRNYK